MKKVLPMGISSRVCRARDCENMFTKSGVSQSFGCILMCCDDKVRKGYPLNGCPIPFDCPNKSLHIMEEMPLEICLYDRNEDCSLGKDVLKCPMVKVEIYYAK